MSLHHPVLVNSLICINMCIFNGWLFQQECQTVPFFTLTLHLASMEVSFSTFYRSQESSQPAIDCWFIVFPFFFFSSTSQESKGTWSTKNVLSSPFYSSPSTCSSSSSDHIFSPSQSSRPCPMCKSTQIILNRSADDPTVLHSFIHRKLTAQVPSSNAASSRVQEGVKKKLYARHQRQPDDFSFYGTTASLSLSLPSF